MAVLNWLGVGDFSLTLGGYSNLALTRVPDWLHDEATELFDSLGMNMSTALNVFLRQCVINRAIPFPVALDAQRDRENADDEN